MAWPVAVLVMGSEARSKAFCQQNSASPFIQRHNVRLELSVDIGSSGVESRSILRVLAGCARG